MVHQIMLLQIELKSGYIATHITEMASLLHGAAEYAFSGFSSQLPLVTECADRGLTPI